jgi:sugar phosphate permease
MSNQRWVQIIPVATIMYIIAFTNRANVSQALPSMSRDLHMNAVQAGTIAGVFYWGYLLLQVPGGYLASRWSTKWFVSILLVVWGTCSVGCGLVHSWREMWVMRLLLGVAEGGMYPATIVLLSHWFPRHERARAYAWFVIAIPLSLALSAPVSGWLLQRWNWRVMLIVEGAFPLVWLLIWIARIYDYPYQAPWISADEREYLETEFRRDVEQREPLDREIFLRALLNPQTLLLASINLVFLVGQLGYLFWLPSAIEKAKNVDHFLAGLLYTIPFVVGAIALVVNSAHSDKTRERRGHVAAAMAAGGLALISGVLLIDRMPKLGFAFVSLGAIGAFAPLGPFWTIPTEVFSRKMAGSVAGLVNGIGNLGGFVGPLLVGYLEKRTGSFVYGFVLLGAFMFIGAALMLGVAHRPTPARLAEASAESD